MRDQETLVRVKIDRDLWIKIRFLATFQDKTVSEFLEEILRDFLERGGDRALREAFGEEESQKDPAST